MQQIFFNASLPRSGGTLLQNILAQNKDFYTTSHSTLNETIISAKDQFTFFLQYNHQDEVPKMKESFYKFCKEGMKAYCNNLSNGTSYFMDKSFAWGYHYDFLEKIFGEKPKIVIMVRDLRDIFCSFEQNFRRDPLKYNMNVNWNDLQHTTMVKRVTDWATKPPLALSLEYLKGILDWGNGKNVHIMRYEDFCTNPQKELKSLYDYLQIPFFVHDTDKIEKVTKENDVAYFASHQIRSQVKMNESKALEVLGQNTCDWIYKNHEWYFKTFYMKVYA